MDENRTIPPTSVVHTEKVNGATYIVQSNYVGKITFLDLLKQMIKRDIERGTFFDE
ncbi:MAG: hypothetical protein FWE32_02040 [Oscillospiraceae bacterium]|nr:hypothetical protein [Oscillospiraceae bacterium]